MLTPACDASCSNRMRLYGRRSGERNAMVGGDALGFVGFMLFCGCASRR